MALSGRGRGVRAAQGPGAEGEHLAAQSTAELRKGEPFSFEIEEGATEPPILPPGILLKLVVQED